MGRLVDADDFKRFLQALCKAGAPYEEVIQLLDKQPTAYDVDNVVSKIRRYSGNGYRDVDGDYVPPMIEIKYAIEIIREGSVHE